jgi:D-beta-D-heptose 7-phosphate kinase/D-beta-D-heptose 1-phosphate adenosyltransferase
MTNVIVNGSFDILHVGHLRMLKYAKDIENSYVLVLIDSDERVKELKGKDRPVNNQEERKEMLESLKFVDEVKIFNTSEELKNFIRDFNTDIMVKGSDYKNKPIIGSEYCKEIRFYDYVDGYSTTNKIQHITNRR